MHLVGDLFKLYDDARTYLKFLSIKLCANLQLRIYSQICIFAYSYYGFLGYEDAFYDRSVVSIVRTEVRMIVSE